MGWPMARRPSSGFVLVTCCPSSSPWGRLRSHALLDDDDGMCSLVPRASKDLERMTRHAWCLIQVIGGSEMFREKWEKAMLHTYVQHCATIIIAVDYSLDANNVQFHVKSDHTYSPTRRVYSAAGQEMKSTTSLLRIAAVCKQKGVAENEDGEESSSVQFAHSWCWDVCWWVFRLAIWIMW